MRRWLRVTVGVSSRPGWRSTTPLAALPPASRRISWVARRSARGASSARIPRSNLYEASVLSRSDADVRRVFIGSKLADSRSTVFVPSCISLLAPPMTPASPTASEASAMVSTGGSSVRLSPSKVVMTSPGRAARMTMVLSFTVSKSKA